MRQKKLLLKLVLNVVTRDLNPGLISPKDKLLPAGQWQLHSRIIRQSYKRLLWHCQIWYWHITLAWLRQSVMWIYLNPHIKITNLIIMCLHKKLFKRRRAQIWNKTKKISIKVYMKIILLKGNHKYDFYHMTATAGLDEALSRGAIFYDLCWPRLGIRSL